MSTHRIRAGGSCGGVWLWLAAAAGAAAAEPALRVSDRGEILDLGWAGGPTIHSISLLIPKPGWNGHLFQQDSWAASRCEGSAATRSWRVTGQATWDSGGLDLEQTVTVAGEAVKASYRLRFRGETSSEGVRLLLRTATDGMAGEAHFLSGLDGLALATPLPAELPAPYHLTSATRPVWVGWQKGEAVVRLRPDGDWLAEVSVQDDRQFKMTVFEAQLVAADTRQLRDGQELRLDLTVEPGSLTQLAAQGIRRVEAKSVWDTARVDMAARGEPSLGPVTWSAQEGPRWRPIELRFGLTGTWTNPFDPDQVEVQARIDGPDGLPLAQPAFVYQDFALVPGAGQELLFPRGEREWRVRWTPQAEGRYRVRIDAMIAGQRLSQDAGEFVCQGASGPGFVRRLADTPYYLGFDDGSPYFAIGENICWDGQTPVASFRKWFERLGRAGGNYCRIWLVRWNLGLEWTPTDAARRGVFYGLGCYSLDNAWRLDQVLQAAADNGIYVMLCLGYHGELLDQKAYFGEQCWDANPYNAGNGGPCAKPADFWTDATARRLYQRRLRYYLARWGADPNVLSWEFWNEVFAPAAWIDEMSRYLATHDLHRHLRTTTYGKDDTWQLELMDYTQEHHYGADGTLVDSAPVIARTAYALTEKYRKPFLMGEFGIDWKSSDRRHDPTARATNLHNGIWAALASRSLGTAAIWYWDDYIDGLDLYGQFTPLAAFAKRVQWRGFAPTRPAQLAVEFVRPPPPAFADQALQPAPDWRRQPDGEARVGPEGEWLGEAPTAYLFSPGKPDLCSPLKLHLDLPNPGTARLTVGQVSVNAKLVVTLDGQELVTREFPCGPPGQGRYRETKWAEQWQIWQSVFNEEVAFDLPAGEHRLQIANTAGDWMTIPTLVLPQYRNTALPDVRALLLVADRQAIGWLQDRASTWQADRDGTALPELAPLRLRFTGMQDGAAEVTWFDPWAGTVIGTTRAVVQGGQIEVETPRFRRDVAVLIQAVAAP